MLSAHRRLRSSSVSLTKRFSAACPAGRLARRPRSTLLALSQGVLALALALALLLALPVTARAGELKVVASFSILGDLVRQVGGERVALTTLVGVNGDPHVYEPRPADAVAVAAADVVFVNGLHFEGFLPRLLAASATRAPVIELSRGAALLDEASKPVDGGGDERHLSGQASGGRGQSGEDHRGHHRGEHDHSEHDHGEHDHGEHDHGADDHSDHAHADHGGHDHGPINPHAWQSVANARVYVANIAAALCRVDAAGCDGYRGRAKAYDEELAAVDREIRAALDPIPADRRTVITSHDAFGYFGHAYRLSFRAPSGLSTEAQASARDVATLIRAVRASKASALFVENVGDPRLVEQIARETGLTVGGVLYSDSLSGRDGVAWSYVELMRHNARTIARAILGRTTVPGTL